MHLSLTTFRDTRKYKQITKQAKKKLKEKKKKISKNYTKTQKNIYLKKNKRETLRINH